MTDQPDYELYGFWRSSATYRIRVAMALKGLHAKEHPINLESGEQRNPAFLAVNPQGAVPALIVPGHPPITQSLAILEFLEETHPAPAILPAEPFGRARVRSLASLMVADTHPLVVPRMRAYLTTTGGFDADAWRAWQLQWFGAGMRTLEKRLASEAETGAFCHGDSVTMADICMMSVIAVMRVFKIAFDDTPHVGRIIARCEALEAFANAAPSKQPGAPAA
jgi:maleylacetoacetate isomerase